jgi:hypothetical protein
MPEQPHPGDNPRRAAEKREEQQYFFRNAAFLAPRCPLIRHHEQKRQCINAKK